MLQNLLAERFRLVIHHDIIVLSVYELVVAKNGPKLKEARTIPGDVPPTPPAPPGARDRDGFPVLPGPGLISSYGADRVCHLKAREQPIANLLRMLRGPNGADRTIINETGLTGKYDFTLYYALEIPGSSATGEAGDRAPTLFDALQQQLGLKLVNAKASFDHIVIDHAEKIPTEN